MSMEAFREFDEPGPDNRITSYYDGSFLIDLTGLPPVAWTTGIGDYVSTYDRTNKCFTTFWGMNKELGLEELQRIIDDFSTEHVQELAEAALEHELTIDSEMWPVEKHLEELQTLYDSWKKLLNVAITPNS